MSETAWVDTIDNIMKSSGYLTLGEELGALLVCSSFAILLLATLGGIAAPVVAIVRLIDDWRVGKPSIWVALSSFLHSWSMLLPLIWIENVRSGKAESRNQTIIYVVLYTSWIIGVTGLWALNIVNGSFFYSGPQSQHPGEVFITTFAMFTVFLTGIISAIIVWLNHRIYRTINDDSDIESVPKFDVLPFVLSTAWFWVGLIDNLLGVNNDVPLFALSWFMIFCSGLWILWAVTRLLFRYSRLRRLSNSAGRG